MLYVRQTAGDKKIYDEFDTPLPTCYTVCKM
jgi:hypothetical protein